MTPPTVLLDRSFLDALVDPTAGDHIAARRCYARLLPQYVSNTIRLRARRDHLRVAAGPDQADLVAPIEPIHLVGQYRRQATRLGEPYSPDLALTLVVMRRESIDRIATFDPFFDSIDVIVER
jgi:predicted nucleic acid-binding protein